MAEKENLHKRLVRAAAERVGYEVHDLGIRGWNLIDRGRVMWRVSWLKSGYFGGAFNERSNYAPDYRTHAYTSTPREILDRWLKAEFPEEKP